jgi:predicted PurR-regulated permease PerM
MDAPYFTRPPPPYSRRLLFAAFLALAAVFMYVLRGVLIPLFFAFLVAYALDPVVDRLQRLRVPRSIGAPLTLLALIAVIVATTFIAVPMVVDEFAEAARRLPDQLVSLHARTDALLRARFDYKMPATWGEVLSTYGTVISDHVPDASRIGGALFGTMSALFVLLGMLIVPVFALYLLGDFDQIIDRAAHLIPRRWAPSVTAVVSEVHLTLGRYLRGQLITILVLCALYSVGLKVVGIRLAVPIGVLTGLLAFIPYVGLAVGTGLAVLMAILDWHSTGQVIGVCVVMGGMGLFDAMVITPRIVGGSVGLKPIEVLLTMMAAATLFGFLGVLLAVPLGAVMKILIGHAVDAYLGSSFYRQPALIPSPQLSAEFDRTSEGIAFRSPDSGKADPGEGVEAPIESVAPRG